MEQTWECLLTYCRAARVVGNQATRLTPVSGESLESGHLGFHQPLSRHFSAVPAVLLESQVKNLVENIKGHHLN